MAGNVQFDREFEWTGPSADPNDEQFGDVVEPATLESADEFDAVLVGEPYDGAVIGRRGAREGPSGIRRELAWVKTHHFDAGPVDGIGDLGSVRVPEDSSVSAVQSRLREWTSQIHDAETLPVFLGGDNSLTMPNVAPLLDRDGSVGVVNLDAHLDCRAVEGEPSSGTPYRQLLEAGLDQLVVVGARHFETSTAYADYLRANDGEIVTAEEVGDDPVAAANRALSPFDVDHLYVSVDVDVLDATAAPGVSAPTPGGLSTRDLFRVVRLLVSAPVLAGFEVVETAPPLCQDGRTVAAAARTVAHALATARGESG